MSCNENAKCQIDNNIYRCGPLMCLLVCPVPIGVMSWALIIILQQLFHTIHFEVESRYVKWCEVRVHLMVTN